MGHEKEINPKQFLQWIVESREAMGGIVIDVREDFEWDYYHLDETEWIPMHTIPARIHEFPKDKPIYVICAHGIRSASVCDYLDRMGFANTINVIGGMAAVAALKGFQYD